MNDTPKVLNTYIGQKGYTLLKKEMTQSHVDIIRKDLFVRPRVPGAPVPTTGGFKVYRESNNKYLGT